MSQQMLIAALVPAADADDALSVARGTFDRLVGAGARTPVFESYATFTGPTAALTERWGTWPATMAVRQEPGASLLERQWAETLTAFLDRLEQVGEAIRSHAALELMCDVDGVRRLCSELGATAGPTIYLYDEYGLGIRHRDRLDAVLTQGDRVWIVPAEVRY